MLSKRVLLAGSTSLLLFGLPVYLWWTPGAFNGSVEPIVAPPASDGSSAQGVSDTSRTGECPPPEVVEVEVKVHDPEQCPKLEDFVPEYLRPNAPGEQMLHAVWRGENVDYSARYKNPIKDPFPEAEVNRTTYLRSLYGMDGDRSWLDHINSLPDMDILPLTKHAQKMIYDHQNPADCSGKRFIGVRAATGQGLGSALHVLAENIAFAMFYDRIAVFDEGDIPLYEFQPDCKNCVFEPLTKCQSFATPETTDTTTQGFQWPGDPFHKPHGLAPPQLALEMRSRFPDLTPNALKLWIRAQTVAYAARLTPSALQEIRDLRLDKKKQSGSTQQDGKEVSVPTPFPMNPQTWGIHIRHGDKFKEMHLVPLEKYIEAAEKYSRYNPLSMQKWAFIMSEDPGIFELRKIDNLLDHHTSPSSKWTFWISDITRINTGPIDQLNSVKNATQLTLEWMSQLLLMLECDGFVGTRSSGWSRLFDELRGVWAPAARSPFLEVGREWDWEEYWW